MLEGVLEAVGVELEDIGGGRLRGWRDDRLRLWRRRKRCGAALLTLPTTPSVPASICVVGLIIWQPEARLTDPVRALVAVVSVGIGVAIADGAELGVGASGRDRVRTLAIQEEY